MSPERWRRAEILYLSALEQPPSGRAIYLQDACAGDEELRELVGLLLEQGDVPDSPLERPVVSSDRFGPYILGEKLGSGGMGEVYKAYDPRLNRTVAIKVLKAPFTDRFLREARAIAALNHPHICTLYDIGPDYLVMEYVEGKTLSGPLRLEEVLDYTRQICEALEAAHRAGIVHRDLKPANILVTKLGIKLLDFGIARDMQGQATLSAPGMLLGTPAYMAPEMLAGQPADARSDIYSVGCVLQVVTGSRNDSRKLEPPQLDRVVRTCQAQDPDNRWQSARELKLALELVRHSAAVREPGRRFVWVGFTVLLLTSALVALLWRRPQPTTRYRFQIDPPEGWQIYSSSISPDATMLALSAVSAGRYQCWLRRLDSLESHPLPGTEGCMLPFWSPDSRRFAFHVPDKLKTVDVTTGSVQTICDLDGVGGGAWNQEGVLLFTRNRVIYRVSAAGGAPKALTKLHTDADEAIHGSPRFLPDGRRFLFNVEYGRSGGITVQVSSLNAPEDRKRLMEVDSHGAAYVPPLGSGDGYILYPRRGVLMAQGFDLQRIEKRGEPIPIIENVAAYSASSGAIATRPEATRPMEQLVWRDRRGKELDHMGSPGSFAGMSLSTDGTRLAYTAVEATTGETDVWVRDRERGTTSRLPSTGPDFNPVWSPDGGQLAFGLGGVRARVPLYRRVFPTGEPESLGIDGNPTDWSGDGRFLLTELGVGAGTYLRVLDLGGDRKPAPFFDGPTNESEGRFSPERSGPPRWIAYTHWEPAGHEVYVQRFSAGKIATGARWKVSVSGGRRPRWRADGKELFYRQDGKIVAVSVQAQGSDFRPGVPVTLFDGAQGSDYVVTSDGSRFLLSEIIPNQRPAPPQPITITLNWQAALK